MDRLWIAFDAQDQGDIDLQADQEFERSAAARPLEARVDFKVPGY